MADVFSVGVVMLGVIGYDNGVAYTPPMGWNSCMWSPSPFPWGVLVGVKVVTRRDDGQNHHVLITIPTATRESLPLWCDC